MVTGNEDAVVCAFCGKSLAAAEAVKLVIILGEEETQTIFAHPAHLRAHLHPSIPLHPDVEDAPMKPL